MEIYTNSLFWIVGAHGVLVSRTGVLLLNTGYLDVSKRIRNTILLLVRGHLGRHMTLGLRLSLCYGDRKRDGSNPHRILSQTWVQSWKRSPHKNPRALNGRPRGVHLYFYSGLSLSCCCCHSFLPS